MVDRLDPSVDDVSRQRIKDECSRTRVELQRDCCKMVELQSDSSNDADQEVKDNCSGVAELQSDSRNADQEVKDDRSSDVVELPGDTYQESHDCIPLAEYGDFSVMRRLARKGLPHRAPRTGGSRKATSKWFVHNGQKVLTRRAIARERANTGNGLLAGY